MLMPNLPTMRVPEKDHLTLVVCYTVSSPRPIGQPAQAPSSCAFQHLCTVILYQSVQIEAAPHLRDLVRFLRAVIICKLCTS